MRLRITVLLLFYAMIISGQYGYKFNSISVANGLSSKTVVQALQDQKGFMWFATKNGGLNRYDGVSFKVYTHDTTNQFSICNNNIIKIFESKEGYIYVFTKVGVCRFDQITEKFHKIEFPDFDFNKREIIYSASQDKYGKMWFATSKGLYVIASVGDIPIKINSYNGIFNYDISEVYCDSSSVLVTIVGMNKIFKITNFENVNNFICEEKVIPLSYMERTYGLQVFASKIWFAESDKVISYDLQHQTAEIITFPNLIDEQIANKVLSISFDNDSNLWAGSSTGLTSYNYKTKKRNNYTYSVFNLWSIQSSSILHTYKSRDGVMWFSHGEGVNFLNLSSLNIQHIKSIEINQVNDKAIIKSIYQHPDGTLYLAAFGEGLIEIKDNQKTNHKENPSSPNELISNQINKIIYYKDKLYLGTTNGLCVFDITTKTFKTIKQHDPSQNFIYDIDIDNETLWIVSRYGLAEYNIHENSFKYYQFSNKIERSHVVKNYKEVLFIGSSIKSFNVFDKKTKSLQTISQYFGIDEPENFIYAKSIIVSPDSLLWIGGLDGIMKFNLRDLSYDISRSFDNVKLFSAVGMALIDESLWISTRSNGIIKYDTKEKTAVIFDNRLGIQSTRFADNAIFFNQNGEIFFGGGDGVNIIKTKKLTKDSTQFRLSLTDIKINNKSLSNINFINPVFTSNIELKSSDRMITIDFALLSYYLSEFQEYKVKLVGFDEDWVNIGNQRRITYTNLSSGKYLLKINAKNLNGEWMNHSLDIPIYVIAPFYKRVWFSVFVLLFLLLLLFIWTKIQKKHEAFLKATVEDRTREIIAKSNEINRQSIELEAKNKDITDSIEYAQKIQHSIFPPQEQINKILPDHFIFFQPKDIVSGDFYWIEPALEKSLFFSDNKTENQEFFIGALDCTGHGVPGGFMSMLGYMLLNQAVREQHLAHPYEILNYLDQEIKSILHREEKGSRDGMDASILKFNLSECKLEYACANSTIFQVRDKIKFIHTGDKMSVGSYLDENSGYFVKHDIEIQKGDCIYIFSDGYQDQVGGDKEKRLGKRKFYEILMENNHLPMEQQKNNLIENFNNWKNDYPQMDDILVIGIRI